ncbi:sortase [Myceligenerans pegani]|uniref:Class E sortase n=1 Tax=Myceligenerans pegani TaxID=2776917 RepID=A0ABR9N1Y6_9MICO|nr:class E sortase [Myceligenerans sp. TRM 65318]MBE1877654.1 class E sortase [Myceligenerans sp. TRM 65318]MBE3019925.1 class E sortase [Myceligenerans sp. TRM 65318]
MSNPVTPSTENDEKSLSDNPSPADAEPSNPYPARNTPASRRRRARLAAAVAAVGSAPRPKAPRDGRWWAGAAIMTVSMLLIAFVGHAALFSAAQHHREQVLAYDELRTSLARATTPVGQLDLDGDLVEPGAPVALLEIPALGLSEVVAEGSTSRVLRSGPGHRRDSVMPGQAGTSVILGRQLTYGGPFGGLERLVPGDEIRVTTGQGEHTFQVFNLRRAGDPLPEPLAAGQGRLELMTADGLQLFPSGVLHVDAQLVSEVQPTPTKVLAEPALPAEERAMAGDDGAWYTAFFVLTFFVAAGAALWWLWTSWGRWHAWLIGVPVLLALGVTCADIVMDALPNLL